jgi:hypothetical protein
MYNKSMGRHKLPLACSRCHRTPDEVRILSNRYCVDCMRAYNKRHWQLKKPLYAMHQSPSALREGTVQDGMIYTDGHWEPVAEDA